jgi:predicted DNA-binding transcriptional regulator YafY
MDKAYGIFFEGPREKVVLKFSEYAADYVREQVWFPSQTIEETPDGGLRLSFYVTDYREIVREVLSFGADVEVLEPGSLKEIIRGHIQKLSRIY